MEKSVFLKHYFYFDDTKKVKEPEIIEGSLKELSLVNVHTNLEDISEDIKNAILDKICKMK